MSALKGIREPEIEKNKEQRGKEGHKLDTRGLGWIEMKRETYSEKQRGARKERWIDRMRDMEREGWVTVPVCVSTKAVKVICCQHAHFLRSHTRRIDWASNWQVEGAGCMNLRSACVWKRKGVKERTLTHSEIQNYDSEQNSVKPWLESASSGYRLHAVPAGSLWYPAGCFSRGGGVLLIELGCFKAEHRFCVPRVGAS